MVSMKSIIGDEEYVIVYAAMHNVGFKMEKQKAKELLSYYKNKNSFSSQSFLNKVYEIGFNALVSPSSYQSERTLIFSALSVIYLKKIGYDKKQFEVFYDKIAEDYAGKIVMFQYSGGSSPNENRLVAVDECKDNYILGRDIKHMLNDKEPIRKYLLDKIIGEIKVVS